jgi:hypothetical protein
MALAAARNATVGLLFFLRLEEVEVETVEQLDVDDSVLATLSAPLSHNHGIPVISRERLTGAPLVEQQ